MKLMIAIVQDEDAGKLIGELMDQNFGVTKLATTGGFLKSGNTTLLIGIDESRYDECLAIIEKVCKSRKQMTTSPVGMSNVSSGMYTSYPIEVTVGGATVFVLSVDQFVKF
ncbi:MAG: cyclic-di-AMP receptor [Clostridia bacterium]|nr:cyclic-di-AMP receptor [Clostridia bacterium]MBQ6232790.1 cyclic-di-AMP receptor [Clostridia bacterium]